MAKHKVEIQDHLGNIYYPHTTTDVVFDQAGQKLSSLLDNKSSKSIRKISLALNAGISVHLWEAYAKINDTKLVEIYAYLKKADGSKFRANDLLFTLPVGFRPSSLIEPATTGQRYGASGEACTCLIRNDGRVTAQNIINETDTFIVAVNFYAE